MKKRGVLSLWKVIMLVIAGIVGVVGVAVLTLYLMGRFEDEFVEPSDMSFVQTIDDGAGFYNLELGQFEVSSNFKMTLTTSTENVTEKKVTLSLKNGQAKDGYITDGVVKVPQEVFLNRPFEVVLEPEYNADILQDWIVGGNSVLTAKSTNVLLPTQTIKIAVDVPVYNIDVSVEGSENFGNVQEVVVGTDFSIATKFTPKNSKFLFSNKNAEKNVYYSHTSSFINYDWQTGRFRALQRSGSNTDTITVYTFSNSYYQKQVMDLFSSIQDPELLASNVLRYFEQNPQSCVSKMINIKVLDVDVDSVEISTAGKTLKTYMDKYFTLTTSSANGDANLGLSIKDSNGVSLNSLFGNVAIKIPKGKSNLKILGGKIMKVVSNDLGVSISQEDFNADFDYSGADSDTNYYVLPNTTPKEYADYFWKFSASSAEDFQLCVNFFYEDETGVWKNFFNFESGSLGGEKIFNLLTEDHDYEEDPAWTNNDTINLTINYNEQGEAEPSTIDLSDLLNDINTENIYRTTKYFLLVDTTDAGYAENVNMQEAFVCGAGVNYDTDYKNQPLTIPMVTKPEGGYVLFELSDSNLVALKSFAGKVKVVAATIKTDADLKPYKTNDGKYLIVKMSRGKDIMVESTLSIANMDPSFSFAAGVSPNADFDNEYYLPAINRNESATQKTMITMELKLKNSEDPLADVDKVVNAFHTGNLEVICLDRNGRKTNNYVTLQGLVQKEINANEVIFEGILAIEEGYFSAGKNSIDRGTYVKLQLQYNDGKETYTKDIFKKDDDTNRDHFFIYYQQPVAMKGEFQNQTDLDLDGDGLADPINVSITANNGIKITWGNRIVPGATTQEILNNLNNLLTFSLKDQFGNAIEESSNIYKVKFEETPAQGTNDYILSFDSTLTKLQNFVSTQGQPKTTTLNVYVVDNEDKYIEVYDVDGNVVSGQRLTTQDIVFNVSSEGVSKVEYDSTDKFESPVFVESQDKGNVVVQKYVSRDTTVDLDRFIKIYTSGADGTDVLTGNFVFKLDNNFISSLSEKNKVDIMKMIQFNATEGQAEGVANEVDSIENYRNQAITRLTITNSFKEDTQIVFTVRDPEETLFNISFTFVCKADIVVSSGFNQYYDKNADYLVQKGNAVGVFAGESYDLDEYIKLDSITGKEYSWAEAFKNLGSLDSSENGVFFESQGICSLEKVESSTGTKIMLKISDVYQFKTVTFTLYYGVNSFYSSSRTFTLYVNPNLVVRQNVPSLTDVPFVNLEEVSAGNVVLSNHFEIYKLTDYISNGANFDGIDKVVSNLTNGNVAFTYENKTEEKYLSITQNGTDFVYGFVNDSTLQLQLGQKVSQEYQLYAQRIGVDSQAARVDAVKIVVAENEKQIIKCTENQQLSLSLNIGYGGDDAQSMASSVLGRVLSEQQTEKVDVVVYDGKINVLLLHLSSYKTQGGFSVRDGSIKGNLYKDDKNQLSTYELTSSFLSVEGNSFMVEKTIFDKTGQKLTLAIEMDAVVSKVGESFVYYSNETQPATPADMVYNKFKDVDFKTLIGSYVGLEENSIYETLQAGKRYTIVHDSQNPLTDVNDVYGFYFDGAVANITGQLADASFNVSIVEEATGYIEGLATLEKANPADNIATMLKINHLESSQDDAYIVLKFELSKYSGNVSLAWYYRIKVNPSFTVGNVLYPYVSNGLVGEYLDMYSNYYDETTQEYKIDFEENFTAQNSRFESGKRFSNLIWKNGADKNLPLQANYIVKSASANGIAIEPENFSNFFTYRFDGDNFTIKLTNNSSKLNITLEKSFMFDGVSLIGSQMQYVLIFNQSANYVHSLKQADTALVSKNNVYQSTISAGSAEVVYTPDIKISSNGTESKVNEFNAYIAGENDILSGALKNKTYLKKGAEFYEGEVVAGTFDKDIFFGEWSSEIPTFTEYYSKTKDKAFDESKTYYVLKDGVYTEADKTSEDISNCYEKHAPTFVKYEKGFIDVIVGDKTYKVKEEAIDFTFVYLDDANKLHLMPQASISRDNNFQIGFYTDQKVVFKIDLTVTSYFEYQINSGISFSGGKAYSVMGNADGNNIFSKLEVSQGAAGVSIEDFALTLANGNDIYSYVKTLDTALGENKQYYTLQGEEYVVVETPNVAEIKNYYEAVTNADLVHINNAGTNFEDSTIEFAHLLKDNLFKFTGTITDLNENTYSFDFELSVKASFSATKQRRFDDTAARYGGVKFDISVDTIKDKFEPDMAAGSKTTYIFVDGESIISETPANVGSPTTVSKTLTIVSNFDGKKIFEFAIEYRYTTKPNVSITTNYPMPDGKTVLDKEYISTTPSTAEQTGVQYISEAYKDFFNSKAMFGKENRIVVNSLATKKDEAGNDITVSVDNSWNISVANIENATVEFGGKTITPNSQDMSILQGAEDADVAGLTLKFGLINSASNGLITFDVSVNNVTKTYDVVVVAGSVVKISTNTPNYVDNQEKIYAEDLASQPEKELFKSDRILNYSLTNNLVEGTTLYVRLVHKSTKEVQIVTTTAKTFNQVVNIDLGKSYNGFEYQGTFSNKIDAEANIVSNMFNDETIYLSAPKLTNRIVAYYYDNTVIKFVSGTVDLILKWGNEAKDSSNANNFTVGQQDFNKQKSLQIEIWLTNEETVKEGETGSSDGTSDAKPVKTVKTVETGAVYNLFLDVEFTVEGNADDSNNYTTVDVLAGSSNTLLSYTSFGIKNARTGLLFTQDSMSKTSGNITLDMYGFKDELEVLVENSVAKAIHEKLTGRTTDGIKYSTGLSPRAGVDVDKATAGGDLTKNYITVQGVLNEGKTVDYKVFAQGANNDGNHVMMKFTYTVEIGDGKIEKSHNILFKVLPNSEIKFKSKHESAQIYNPQADQVENGQTIASNSVSPYEILRSDTAETFYLWNDGSATDGKSASTIVANMYGSTKNSAKNFKYTYKLNAMTNYNDFGDFNNKFSEEGSVWESDTSTNTYTYTLPSTTPPTSLALTMPQLALGVRNFFVDLENEFGFKARFYFSVSSDLNPQIYDMSTDLTEGHSVAVSSRFQQVNPTPSSTDQGAVVFKEFTYSQTKDTTDAADAYANAIKIAVTGDIVTVGDKTYHSFSLAGAKITATLSQGYTYTKKENGEDKTVTSLDAGSIITKSWGTMAPTNGAYTINIYEASDLTPGAWFSGTTKVAIENKALFGATCVLELKFTRRDPLVPISPNTDQTKSNTNPVGTYTVEYLNATVPEDEGGNNYFLKQIHTPSSSYTTPTIDDNSGTLSTVVLTGIDAFAYRNSLGAIDKNAAIVSKVDDLKVQRIDYYLGETWIGGSLAGSTDNGDDRAFNNRDTMGTKENEKDSDGNATYTGASLVTDKGYSFVSKTGNGKETSLGKEYNENTMKFVVPNINGYLYGTGDVVSNVKMNITLRSVDGDECVLSRYVNIHKNPPVQLFKSTEIVDGQAPEKEDSSDKVPTILNDTLEVKLQPGASTTFAILNKKIDDETNPFESQKIITLTNTKSYAVTEYVGISRSIYDKSTNFKENDKFYLYTENSENVEFWYNGNKLALTTPADTGKPLDKDKEAEAEIAQYLKTETNKITLNIENIAELNSSNFKPVNLYFLYTANGQTYQTMQTFDVKPEFERGKAENNNFFQVDTYTKISNGTETYYVLGLEDWGSKVSLYGLNSADPSAQKLTKDAYKFYFSMNNDGGTVGSAFVDENGTITTTTDFDLKYHTLSIDVFMKVSGFNGQFETSNTKLKIGTFRMFLNSGHTPPNEISNVSGTTRIVSNGAVSSIISVPAGFSVRSNVVSSLWKSVEETISIDKNFSCEVGKSLIFEDLFGNYSKEIRYNRNYHLIGYTKDGTATVVNFNNLNKWTFDTAGNYEINVLVAGRDSSGAYVYHNLTANLIVYETSTREEQYAVLDINEKSLDKTHTFAEEFNWYLINDNDSTVKKETEFTPAGIGIFTNTYIVEDKDTKATKATKIVSMKFYVHNGEQNKDVAIRPFSTFQLSNLIEETGSANTYEFYSLGANGNGTPSKVSTEMLSYGENSNSTISYIVVGKDAAGGIVSMEKYVVQYKLISSNISQESVTIGKDETISDKVKASIKIATGEEIVLEDVSEKGLLKKTDENETAKNLGNVFQRDYLVTVIDGEKKLKSFHRFSFTFYVYERNLSITFPTSLDNAFELSTMNDEVLKKAYPSEKDRPTNAVVTYYELVGNSLSKVETIPFVEDKTEKTYYVKVTANGVDTFYLIDFTLTVSQSSNP